jgi:hypothetical protein
MYKNLASRVPVAHAYNPIYSGGRAQEDCGSKPAWGNSFVRPSLEKPFTKKGLVDGVAEGVGPEFKPQPVLQKKKKKKQICL